jgi:hypothetical protein
VDGWTATFPAYAGERATWLLLYVALDVVLIVIYGLVVANWLAEHGAGVLAWILRVLAIVDVVEDGLALVTVHNPSVPMGYVTAVRLDGEVVVVLAARAVAAYCALQHGPVIRSWLRGLYTQRFSVIAIVPIAVLTVPPGPICWTSSPTWSAGGSRAAGSGRALLGRRGRRAAHGGRSCSSSAGSGPASSGSGPRRRSDEEKANLWLGVIVPLVLGIGLVAVAVAFRRWPWALPGFDPLRLVLFLLVPVGIVAASWLIRRGREKGWTWATALFSPKNHQVRSAEDKVRISLVGDVLVAVALVVTGWA